MAHEWGTKLAQQLQEQANPNTRWELVGVLEVYEVLEEHLGSGTELYSRFLSENDARRLHGGILPQHKRTPVRRSQKG